MALRRCARINGVINLFKLELVQVKYVVKEYRDAIQRGESLPG